VVVDDGSSDVFTRQVLARLDVPNARLVRLGRSQPSAAWNRGIATTRAPYLVLLDAENLLHPSYLAKAGCWLDERPDLDVVSCAVQICENPPWRWTPPRFSFAEALAHGTFHVSSMFRRKIWETLEGFDEAPLMAYEDQDFWLRAIERGFRGEVLEEPLLRALGGVGTPRLWPGPWRGRMDVLLARHQEAVAKHGPELICAFEAAIRQRQDEFLHLDRLTAEIDAELESLNREIAEARRSLSARGLEFLDWGELRRRSPISPLWGIDRGQPVDRYYIDGFLDAHSTDIGGRVLEVKDSGYTLRFGGGRVIQADVLDIEPGNTRATIVADLARADAIASETYDCFILTQTVHIVYETRSALSHALRILKPGGVLLCTLPALGRINFEDGGLDRGDFWRFTEASVRRLFAELLPATAFDVTVRGNVLACTAFLQGLAVEELRAEELDATDPWMPLLFCVRAVKPGREGQRVQGTTASARSRQSRVRSGVILLYHRVASRDDHSGAWCVSPERFRTHMLHVRRECRLLSLEQLVAAAGAGSLPERAIAVTVDDGYLDALHTASPILCDLEVPATFFVSTGRLDEPHENCHDALARLLLSQPTQLREIEEEFRRLPFGERERVLKQIAGQTGLDMAPRDSHRLLTGFEVVQLAQKPGHTIGSHGVEHLSLPAQPLDMQRQEATESKATLERLLGRPVVAFAYPYGELGPDTIAAVRQAGYTMAVTTERAPIRAGADNLQLGRVEIGECDAEELAALLEQLFGSQI
jgi:peptidoglycan/xylan/chitin deacetylase (PgdA/CDA1 family)/glycosyltransferase involved in cell wall biosynthesis